MRRDVRILLLGDPGVGKTSLILSLVSEEFPEDVPSKAEEITIPADVTPERVPTHIVDFSLREQSEEELKEEIAKAHVCCIVYAVEEEDTIFRIRDYWIPLIHSTAGGGEKQKKPLILVGNKSDTDEISVLIDSVLSIMNDFPEVETCIECSAKNLKNISEMFYYAQKAVLHPTSPLFEAETKELSVDCCQALTRVFKICDLDNDGILNDRELNFFQRRCFNAPLQPHALEDVKCVVRKNIPDGVKNEGLTLKGFLFLNCLFIQRGRHETTWTVLRRFGYDDNLALSKDHLMPKVAVPRGSSTELSHLGVKFLSHLFDTHDTDRDGYLNHEELDRLFSVCPENPWGPEVHNAVHTNEKGWISHRGFIAQWSLTTSLDIHRAFEYLAYLGYNIVEDSDQTSAVIVTREKKIDLQKKQTSRTVFLCQVIGTRGCGKTGLLQGLLGRTLRYQSRLKKDQISRFTINTVPVYGQEKYLLLHEVDVSQGDRVNGSDACDVIALVYDVTNPRSFEYIVRVYRDHLTHCKVPILFVALRSDQRAVRQDSALQPEEWIAQHQLAPLQRFTCADRISKDVYIKLATMAAYPAVRHFPSSSSSASGKSALFFSAQLILVAGALAAAGFAVYRALKTVGDKK